MKKSAMLVAAALIGISVAASPSDAQNAVVGGGGVTRGQGGGGGTGGFRAGGRSAGSVANTPGRGTGSFRGSGRRGGGAVVRGGGHGGWRGAGPGPGPRYYGGRRHDRGGPGVALGAAALGLAAGAIFGAPAYVDEPPVFADECMQQVWIRGAWRWRNMCD